MISNRCARKSLVTNCNSIISKNYLRFLVDSNDINYEKNNRFFAVIVQMVLLSNCVEKQGYYNDGEESIIALICDITWTGGKKEYEDGSSWESIWNFDKDGTYTRANVEIDKDGNKKEGEIRGRWSFATPNFSTLYFGGSHYWDIKELDKTIFSFYDRTGELNDPAASKEYVEFYPYNDGKTNYTTYLIIKKCS